jgi:hypothetical protein
MMTCQGSAVLSGQASRRRLTTEHTGPARLFKEM